MTAFRPRSSGLRARAALICVGAQRLGVPLGECRLVVIGDTPKDVLAAQAMGAECLAVATGGFTLAQLEAAGPTHSVARLTDESVAGFLVQGR